MVFNSSSRYFKGISFRLKIILLFLAPVLFIGCLRAGNPLKIVEIQSCSDIFADSDFKPALLELGPGSEYFLDLNNRRISVKKSTGKIIYTGGFGRELDALFDPVDHAGFDLNYFICDRSDNRILRFDQNLNYIDQIPTILPNSETPLYPNHILLDPWGQIFIYSRNFHTIYKYEGQYFSPFLDLNSQSSYLNCLSQMQFDSAGNFMLLYSCQQEVHIYNRAGRLLRKYAVHIDDPELIIYTQSGWIIFNKIGQGQMLSNNEMFSIDLNPEEFIMDIASNDQDLVILTSENVLRLIYKKDN